MKRNVEGPELGNDDPGMKAHYDEVFLQNARRQAREAKAKRAVPTNPVYWGDDEAADIGRN